jgi:hypothetical protein
VQRAAKTALDLASRGPVFPRHKDVGVVDADAKTLRRLRKLAKQLFMCALSRFAMPTAEHVLSVWPRFHIERAGKSTQRWR